MVLTVQGRAPDRQLMSQQRHTESQAVAFETESVRTSVSSIRMEIDCGFPSQCAVSSQPPTRITRMFSTGDWTSLVRALLLPCVDRAH